MALPDLKPVNFLYYYIDYISGIRSNSGLISMSVSGDTLTYSDSHINITVTYDESTKIWSMDYSVSNSTSRLTYAVTWPIETPNTTTGTTGDTVYYNARGLGIILPTSTKSDYAWNTQPIFGYETEGDLILSGFNISVTSGLNTANVVTFPYIDNAEINDGTNAYLIVVSDGINSEKKQVTNLIFSDPNTITVDSVWENSINGTFDLYHISSELGPVAFAPMQIMADSSNGRFVASAEFPPINITMGNANEQMYLRHNRWIGNDENSIIKIFYFVVNEEIIDDGINREPWMKCCDFYYDWINPQIEAINLNPTYSDRMKNVTLGIQKFIMNLSEIDSSFLGNFEDFKDEFSWFQVWGQMSDIGGSCCTQDRTIHSKNSPEIENYFNSLDSNIVRMYYTRGAPSSLAFFEHRLDENFIVSDSQTALDWWLTWISNTVSWGANTAYLDTFLSPLGNIRSVGEYVRDNFIESVMEGVQFFYPLVFFPIGFVAGSSSIIQSGVGVANRISGDDRVTINSGNFDDVAVGDQVIIGAEGSGNRRLIVEKISSTEVRISPNWETTTSNSNYSIRRFTYDTVNYNQNNSFVDSETSRTFVSFGMYFLRNHLIAFGAGNSDAHLSGYTAFYLMEREAFLHGAKFIAGDGTGDDPDLAEDEISPVYNTFYNARNSVSWNSRSLTYKHDIGISDVSDGLRVRRFTDINGDELFAVENWDQTSDLTFTFNNSTILASTDQLSIELISVASLPRMVDKPIFVEYFRYRGSANIQTQISVPDNWTVNSGTFSILSEVQLDVTVAGEMQYSGTSLRSLKTKDVTDASNYAFQVFFVGQTNLVFSIIGRRESSASYAFTKIDFENQTIEIGDTSSSSTISYNLGVGDYYKIELWFYNDIAYVLVNNHLVATTTTLRDSHDFSLRVDQLPTSGTAVFKGFRVFELIEQPTAGAVDNSDLVLKDRINLIAEINNPSELTWSYFKALDKKYQELKGKRMTEDSWEALGYEMRPPTTEEFFND